MALSKIARSKKSFGEKISGQSQSSIVGIFQAIGNFENFCMEKYGKADVITDLKNATDDEVYDLLQSWINWNGSRAPRTMAVYFSRLRKYLHYMGIKLNEQDIKNELEFRHSVQDDLYGLTLDDIHTIFKELRYKHRVLFMCQLSSLMRIAEIVQIRKKHLILDQKNIIVKIPSTIAKNSSGRTTFFSKESSKLLRPILKDLQDDDLVFGSSDHKDKTPYQNMTNSASNAKQVLRNAVRKTGLTKKYESTGRLMISTHSFRAYGITKLSRFDSNFTKKISGQKGYLLQYDRMSDEEKLDLYEKFETELTVDTAERLRAENEKLEKEKSENISLQKQITELTNEMSTLKLKHQAERNDDQTKLGFTKDMIIHLSQDDGFRALVEKTSKEMRERKPWTEVKKELDAKT
ncbi:MAG: tyrosine-type recombinase/integrase [Nitrosopumilus sp.]|nr:tyrosine-type recombinase/integrase [Nitrosopumilus sp.]